MPKMISPEARSLLIAVSKNFDYKNINLAVITQKPCKKTWKWT